MLYYFIYVSDSKPGASAEVAAHEADRSMVEQFCTLLRGKCAVVI